MDSGLSFLTTWRTALPLWQAGYVDEVLAKVAEKRQAGLVYPPAEEVFRAFESMDFADVRVVILGQDPYHGEGQAHGMAFSVPQGIPAPPSLKNIFKELKSDLGIVATNPNLSAWAKQGVLLLNSVLTVDAGAAGSHQKLGWQRFTDHVIEHLSQAREGLVFILWGNYARSKKSLIDPHKHLVLEAGHPSPLSVRHFLGSKPFSQTNIYLVEKGKPPISWQTQESPL